MIFLSKQKVEMKCKNGSVGHPSPDCKHNQVDYVKLPFVKFWQQRQFILSTLASGDQKKIVG